MKTITLILFTSVLLNHLVKAQEYEYIPFPTENAIWSEMFYFFGWSSVYPDDTMSMKYALFNEDTVIDGREGIYQKIFKVSDSIPTRSNAVLIGFIREENKKVFYLPIYYDEWDEPTLLYNFNAQVGDTVFNLFPIHSDLEVYKIDTIEIFNKKRKRFHLSFFDGMDFGAKWIEGIGSVNGLFWPGDYFLNQKTEILCLHENNELVYYNNRYGTCYPDYPNDDDTTDIISESVKMPLNIFPNPASKKVTIEFAKKVSGLITIYSIEGRLIQSNSITNSYKLEINLNGIKTGMYIMNFVDEKNKQLYYNQLVID